MLKILRHTKRNLQFKTSIECIFAGCSFFHDRGSPYRHQRLRPAEGRRSIISNVLLAKPDLASAPVIA
jgi:hypothetical protein